MQDAYFAFSLFRRSQKRLHSMLSSRRGASTPYAGLVAYNGFCVSNGLPLFEEGGFRTFDDFCAHWKENHRILVQRRMVWEALADKGPESGGRRPSADSAAARRALRAAEGADSGNDDEVCRSECGCHALPCHAIACHALPCHAVRSPQLCLVYPTRDALSVQERDDDDEKSDDGEGDIRDESMVNSGEMEHVRLLKFVRDTHVWSNGKRYCEIRAEDSWKDMVLTVMKRVDVRAREIREHEETLEAGRLKHLDTEFQRRVHGLRLEENALKAR